MAYLEHQCRACLHVWHDNDTQACCPKCGAADPYTTTDEDIEYQHEEDNAD